MMATPSTLPDAVPTVFVVDDDAFVREALETMIQVAGWRASTFASADAFLACPPATGPNCLVLDVNLPGLSGLDLQTFLAGDRGDMPIIFMTGFGDIPMSVRAMKAGAAEFLTKPFSEQVMLDAIGAALDRSRAVVGDQAAVQMLRDCYATLSPREQQVMAGVVSGRMNKQVAGELGLSDITVKLHRANMMKKMEAYTVVDLVLMWETLESDFRTLL